MARITGNSSEGILKIERFLGLNENPDGDTKLRLGEASVCRNWKITRDRNLQRRPGSKTILDLGTGEPVMGMWFGAIDEVYYGLAASGDHMWKFYEDGDYLDEAEDLGEFDTSNHVSFFPFSGIVYILNGNEYMQYDGIEFKLVPGYRPLIATSRTPDGSSSTLLEEVNKLTGKRRVWFSPDGESATFTMPETDLLSFDYVKLTSDDTYVDPTTYTFDRYEGTLTFTGSEELTGDGSTTVFTLTNSNVVTATATVDDEEVDTTYDSDAGTLTFTTAPEADTTVTVTETIAPESGTNTYEVGYTAASTSRTDVSKMSKAEIFLGAQDNAVFLYGNGTNEAVYSGVDYWGQPRADYFPDLNEMAVADANTPITGMIRHYSRLLCFKSNSAYTVSFGLITLADGSQEYGFYVTPINRSIGNAALGQVRLVLNSPYTLYGHDLYEWKPNSAYSSNLTLDERQAKRISDRIYSTLSTFDPSECYCYDDNLNQEYYICYEDDALVYNYAADAWYEYTGITISSMCNVFQDLVYGSGTGTVELFSTDYYNDNEEAIDSYWESGSMDMGKNYMRKLMSQIWIGLKPQEASQVTVTVMTDKKSEYTEKTITRSLSTFAHVDFEDFSFLTNRKPQVKKLKIKAKKFAFLKIIFKSSDLYTTATVLSAEPKIRETGYVK